jgi:hypothetical protein
MRSQKENLLVTIRLDEAAKFGKVVLFDDRVVAGNAYPFGFGIPYSHIPGFGNVEFPFDSNAPDIHPSAVVDNIGVVAIIDHQDIEAFEVCLV